MNQKVKGFTLLEMIIVVCVIAVIYLLAVPNIQKVMNVVDNKGCASLTKVVDAAILEYKLEYDVYPNSVSELVNAGFLSEDQTTCSNGMSIGINNGQAVAG